MKQISNQKSVRIKFGPFQSNDVSCEAAKESSFSTKVRKQKLIWAMPKDYWKKNCQRITVEGTQVFWEAERRNIKGMREIIKLLLSYLLSAANGLFWWSFASRHGGIRRVQMSDSVIRRVPQLHALLQKLRSRCQTKINHKCILMIIWRTMGIIGCRGKKRCILMSVYEEKRPFRWSLSGNILGNVVRNGN